MALFSRVKNNLEALKARSKATSNLNMALQMRYQGQPESMGVPSQKWSSYQPEQQKFIANQSLNAAGGMMQPSQFIDAAHKATTAKNLNDRLKNMEMVKREAAEQMTPQELQKVKFPWLDPHVKKIHQRLLNQEAEIGRNINIPAGFNIPNLFRRRR